MTDATTAPHASDSALSVLVLPRNLLAGNDTTGRPVWGDGVTPGGQPLALLSDIYTAPFSGTLRVNGPPVSGAFEGALR